MAKEADRLGSCVASVAVVLVREVLATDGPGLARAWEDARAVYSKLDARAFRGPVPTDAGLGQWLLDGLQQAASDGDHLARVAELAGEPVGFVSARLEAAGDAAGRGVVRDESRLRAHVDVLVVQRAWWRRGVGRALMTAVESWAVSKGAELVKLATYIHSPDAVPFYEAIGFDRRAIVFVKYLPVVDRDDGSN